MGNVTTTSTTRIGSSVRIGKYITINKDNFEDNYTPNFNIGIVKKEDYDTFNLSYDAASIMHYPSRFASKNSLRTMVWKQGNDDKRKREQAKLDFRTSERSLTYFDIIFGE